jgi:hypothetical protein
MAPNVNGSVALTPTRMLVIRRVRPKAVSKPIAMPVPLRSSPWPMTSRKIRAGSAPTSIRIPISALMYKARHDAVEPNPRQQRGNCGRHAYQQQRESRSRLRSLDQRLHGLRFGSQKLRTIPADHVANGSRELPGARALRIAQRVAAPCPKKPSVK